MFDKQLPGLGHGRPVHAIIQQEGGASHLHDNNLCTQASWQHDSTRTACVGRQTTNDAWDLPQARACTQKACMIHHPYHISPTIHLCTTVLPSWCDNLLCARSLVLVRDRNQDLACTQSRHKTHEHDWPRHNTCMRDACEDKPASAARREKEAPIPSKPRAQCRKSSSPATICDGVSHTESQGQMKMKLGILYTL